MEKHPTRLLSYCLMPNHWHLVLWPRQDSELSAFVRWLTHTHSMRWHAHYHTSGTGHIYQGRFKSFPVERDEHFYSVVRYVERNGLRANLVKRAEKWPWSSLWHRQHPEGKIATILHAWPLPQPENWLDWVNAPQTTAELEAVRKSVIRGSPFGSPVWAGRIAKRLALESTLRPRGRPKKKERSSTSASWF
jgi:putative transposase